MTTIHRISTAFVATFVYVLSIPCFALPGSTAAAGTDSKVAAPFKPTLGTFRVSKTPVLLPSWLPPLCNGRPLGIGEGPFDQGYEYWFGESSADTYLFGSGGIGRAKQGKKHVQLTGRRDARLVFYKNVRCLEWQQGKFVYRMGVPDNAKNDPDLIKAANSVVAVPVTVLNTAPRGEDSLAEAYKRTKEMHDESARAEIGANYGSGLEAASRGDHKKAEKLYRELIAKWKQCDEMPPLAQVQMALAQTLLKLGRADEAAQIKKDFAAKAEADEQAVAKEIAEQKTKVDGLDRGSVDYSSARAWLGTRRQKLANLYIASGKYNDAEPLFKTAFNDVASTYGRGAADARSISDDYALLLRTVGRSEGPARQLLAPTSKGHSPVKMTLKPDAGLKKNGAETVILVVEDEYGAPSGDQWFTKKGSLQGIKGDVIVWKKPIKFDDFINMDQCAVSCDGSSVFTISKTLGFNKYTHKFAWDGNKVSHRESKLIETKR